MQNNFAGIQQRFENCKRDLSEYYQLYFGYSLYSTEDERSNENDFESQINLSSLSNTKEEHRDNNMLSYNANDLKFNQFKASFNHKNSNCSSKVKKSDNILNLNSNIINSDQR